MKLLLPLSLEKQTISSTVDTSGQIASIFSLFTPTFNSTFNEDRTLGLKSTIVTTRKLLVKPSMTSISNAPENTKYRFIVFMHTESSFNEGKTIMHSTFLNYCALSLRIASQLKSRTIDRSKSDNQQLYTKKRAVFHKKTGTNSRISGKVLGVSSLSKKIDIPVQISMSMLSLCLRCLDSFSTGSILSTWSKSLFFQSVIVKSNQKESYIDKKLDHTITRATHIAIHNEMT